MGQIHQSRLDGKHYFSYGDDCGGHSATGIFMHLYGDDPWFVTVTLMKGKTNETHRPMMSLDIAFRYHGMDVSMSCLTLDSTLMNQMERHVSDIREPLQMNPSTYGQYHRPDKDVFARHIASEAMSRMTLSDMMQFTHMLSYASFDAGEESLKKKFHKLFEVMNELRQ